MSHHQYLILTNARCSSTWLSNFLTYGPSMCLHDWGSRSTNLRDLTAAMRTFSQTSVGVCDTGLALRWPEVLSLFGVSIPLVVVRRSPEDAARSLCGASGLSLDLARDVCERVDDGLLQVAVRRPGALVLKHSEVTTWAGSKAIWKHLLPGTPFPEHRFTELRDVRVVPMYTR
jgi:hypothetical protein